MKHKYFGSKLNRDVKERKALFRSLIGALIEKGRITTTLAKARAIRSLTEKLVTHAKDESTAAVNKLSSFLIKKDLIAKMREDVVPRFSDKIGGYLRIVRIGRRVGDASEEVIVEWSKSAKKVEKEVLVEKVEKRINKPDHKAKKTNIVKKSSRRKTTK